MFMKGKLIYRNFAANTPGGTSFSSFTRWVIYNSELLISIKSFELSVLIDHKSKLFTFFNDTKTNIRKQ